MSDSRFSDPRMSDPRDYQRPQLDRAGGDVNAVWGWIAAAVFVAAVLLFVFASNPNPSGNGVNMPPTASAPNLPAHSPSSTTGAAPTSPMPTSPAPRGGSGQ
jgi:hypothetical protein